MSQPPLRLQGQTGSVPAKTPTRVIPSWPTKEFLAFQPLLLVDWTWYQASIYSEEWEETNSTNLSLQRRTCRVYSIKVSHRRLGFRRRWLGRK